jgi:Protein of unknown function (DUF1194)
MTFFSARSLAVLACLFGIFGDVGRSKAATEVDLALVLAVDISNSMDPEEQELQRSGFVEAFRSPAVHDAIRGGALGRIAVIYLEWAGTPYQTVVVPWTVIENPESAAHFTDRLAEAPIRRGPRTSIAGAIDFSMRMLEESGTEPLRRVIDISGDGPNNQGRLVTEARDEALAKGITINGLPIMLKRPNGYWDMENLDQYYRDCVIGGAGAFLIPVRERSQFAEAIRTKIIREIAGFDPEPLIKRAQAEAKTTNCLAGAGWNWDRRDYR